MRDFGITLMIYQDKWQKVGKYAIGAMFALAILGVISMVIGKMTLGYALMIGGVGVAVLWAIVKIIILGLLAWEDDKLAERIRSRPPPQSLPTGSKNESTLR